MVLWFQAERNLLTFGEAFTRPSLSPSADSASGISVIFLPAYLRLRTFETFFHDADLLLLSTLLYSTTPHPAFSPIVHISLLTPPLPAQPY